MAHVLTNIRNAIKYGLQQITTDNGYNRTIKYINDPPRAFDSFADFPSVNIDYSTIRSGNVNKGGHSQGGANKYILEQNLDFILDFFLSNQNNPKLEQESILADVQNYFGNNYTIPDSDGDATCLECIFSEAILFSYQREKAPNCGIQIIYRTWFRQMGDDPTQLG